LSLGGIKGGETTGNQWGDMAVGLLGGPVADPLKGLIGSFTGPSNAWQQFGGKLSGTLYGESSAINTLLPWLGKAQTQGDIGQSLDMFRQLVETGAGVGGYQLGKPTDLGAPQIGALPGATGTRHEGGLTADFGPVTTAMNNYIAALYAALPPGGPSGTMTYESFAAGMSPDELGNFTRLAQQGMALPADQQQAFVAQSGLDPQRQDQLLRYIGNPLSPGNERMLYQPDVGGPGDGGGDGGGGI
jgi:hypothetical protein